MVVMDIVILHHSSRKDMLDAMLSSIPESFRVSVSCNDDLNATDAYKAALSLGVSKSGNGFIFMEDDVELCADFESRIIKAIEDNPNRIINFTAFNIKEDGIYPNKGKDFILTQCVYFPKNIAKILTEEVVKTQKLHYYDRDSALVLNKYRINYLTYYPSLVQHISKTSICNPQLGGGLYRQNPSFRK